MGFYSAVVDTDGAGDGDNLTTNVPQWSASFHGVLRGIRYDFDGSTAATADTTISEPNGLQRTIDSVANSATDVVRHPAAAIAGATDAYMLYLVDSSNLKVVIAQGGASVTAAVTITVQIEEQR